MCKRSWRCNERWKHKESWKRKKAGSEVQRTVETHETAGVQEVEKAQQEVYGIGERVELGGTCGVRETCELGQYHSALSSTIQPHLFPFSIQLIRLHPASPVALFDPLPGLLFDHFEVAC